MAERYIRFPKMRERERQKEGLLGFSVSLSLKREKLSRLSTMLEAGLLIPCTGKGILEHWVCLGSADFRVTKPMGGVGGVWTAEESQFGGGGGGTSRETPERAKGEVEECNKSSGAEEGRPGNAFGCDYLRDIWLRTRKR